MIPTLPEESDGEYASDYDSDMQIGMEDDVDAPYGIDLASNLDITRDRDDEE